MPDTEQPPFAKYMGIKLTLLSPDRVEAEMPVREEFRNRRGYLHGGALMAFADSLGGTTATANLAPGQRPATIEGEPNFFAMGDAGDIARAECVPLHRGRSTIVLQTRITRGDGKLAAVVTQTQIVMARGG